MNIFGNVIWIIFGGFVIAVEYFLSGILMCLTIIGVPFGFQVFKLGALSLLPFGHRSVIVEENRGCFSFLMNLIWLLIGGIWIALTHFALGLVLLVVSNILTGIGVYGMTKANLVLDPGNGIVDTLCRTLNRPFSYLRVRFDILLVTFTILSGLVIAHKVVGVGVGTLISAILIGKSVGFTGRLADRYVNHWLQVRR